MNIYRKPKYSVFYILNRCLVSTPLEVVFQHNYEPHEEAIILDKLNNSTSDEINRFSITSNRSKKLILHRKKYGSFDNINQLLNVEGFGSKILRNLCDSILKPPNETNEFKPMRKNRNLHFVTPELSSYKLENMKNIVGVNLGTLSVSWAAIGVEDNAVLSMGHHVLPLSPELKRHNEIQLLDAAIDAFNQLPAGDTFVMESSVLTSGGGNQLNTSSVNQQRIQLASMLLVLLHQAARGRSEEQPVVFQRRSLWCRLFGTLIGSERVSSHSVVDGMLKGATGPFTPILMPDHLCQLYHSSTPIVKEALCSSLLLTLSFIDINVRQLPECLKILRGRTKQNK